ncbi:MAG: RNA-dependent RNA polymerase [Hangzhou phenuivirus 2]|nr:MAG: RNA-dependent RNA polymerase [Hangzhou phenuivirus 2]
MEFRFDLVKTKSSCSSISEKIDGRVWTRDYYDDITQSKYKTESYKLSKGEKCHCRKPFKELSKLELMRKISTELLKLNDLEVELSDYSSPSDLEDQVSETVTSSSSFEMLNEDEKSDSSESSYSRLSDINSVNFNRSNIESTKPIKSKTNVSFKESKLKTSVKTHYRSKPDQNESRWSSESTEGILQLYTNDPESLGQIKLIDGESFDINNAFETRKILSNSISLTNKNHLLMMSSLHDDVLYDFCVFACICNNSTREDIAKMKIENLITKNSKLLYPPPAVKSDNKANFIMRRNKLIIERENETRIKIEDYLNQVDEVETRNDMKTVIQLPYFNLNNNGITRTYQDLILLLLQDEKPDNSDLLRFWRSAFFDATQNPESFPILDTAELENEADLSEEDWIKLKSKYEGGEKLARSRYHRVKPDITKELQNKFSQIGLNLGPNDLLDPLVIEYRKQRKKPFSIKDTPTDDLHTYVTSDVLNYDSYCELRFNDYHNNQTPELNEESQSEDEDSLDSSTTSSEFSNSIDVPNDEALMTLLNQQLICTLIKESQELHINSNQSLLDKQDSFIDSFFHSPFGQYAHLISDIAIEINLSLKQHCKRGNFILKKLTRYPIYLLIKPTKSSSHIYFSLLIEKENLIQSSINNPKLGKTFRKWNVDHPKFVYTDFISTNINKIPNLCLFESRLLNCLQFFMEQLKIEPFDSKIFFRKTDLNDLLWSNVKFCMLVQLTDKDEVEEELTRLRYIMMEGFVNYPEYPDPGKMICKFTKRPKSRLTCYVIKCAIKDIKIIVEGVQFHRVIEKHNEETIRSSNWKNLFHPILHYSLNNPGDLINLFYLGYLNNKNKGTEKNVEGKLFDKIVDMEKKFFKVIKDKSSVHSLNNFGTKPMKSEEDGYHTYDPDILSYITDQFINTGNDLYNNSFLSAIEKEILTRLSFLTIENSLLTLKASSNFTEELEKFNSKENKKYHRSKVIEKVLKITDNEILVVELLNKCLEYLENKNALHICIFKKNQFGGLREIYVLGIEERVCQLVIETISRSICSLFKSETMTNPASKTALPEQHSKLSNTKNKGFPCLLVGSSDDAEKWNQAHYVSKFYQFLIKLTPVYMHPCIHRVLRLWMHKKIMISSDLLEVFEKNHNLETHNETIDELYGIHTGRLQSQPYFKTGDRFLSIRTGMMQGILHYTSSLLHTMLQEFYRKKCLTYLIAIKKEGPVCTVMQSSDDSSVLLTIPITDKLTISMALKLSNLLFKFKNGLSRYLGIYKSVKSTQNTPYVMEFNSQFYFDDSKYHPYIKSVFASSLISEQESLQARQEEMNSLVSDLINNGGSFCLSSGVQYSQALLYYRLMGSSVNSLFNNFLTQIKLVPDPNCGYFLMDNHQCTGVTGFRYNLWNACLNTKLRYLYKTLLTSSDGNSMIDDALGESSLEVLSSGTLARKLMFRFGNRKNWRQFLIRVNLDENWEYKINENPEILYRRATDVDELKLKAAVKMHSPDVFKSFDTTNQLPRIISSGVYCLTYNVFEPVGAWFREAMVKPVFTDIPNINSNKIIDQSSVCMVLNNDLLDFVQTLVYKMEEDGKPTNIVDDLELRCLNVIIKTKRFQKAIKCIFTQEKELLNDPLSVYVKTHCSGQELKSLFNNGPLAHIKIKDHNIILINLKEGRTSLEHYNQMIQFFLPNRLKDLIFANSDLREFIQSFKEGESQLSFDLNNLLNCQVDLRYLCFGLVNRAETGTNFTTEIITESLTQLSMLYPIKEGARNFDKAKNSLFDCLYDNLNNLSEEPISDREIRFLFPNHQEYERFTEVISRFSFQTLKRKTKQRKRITTKLNVFDQQQDMLFSPDKVIGYKWFKIRAIPATEGVINSMFLELQKDVPWLCDGHKETLIKSPFSSHVQIQNWFARNEPKKRIIKIMGAPLISKSGFSGLISAIKNDYSTGFDLSFKIEEQITQKELTGLDLKHMIYMYNTLPMEQNWKSETIQNLLITAEQLPFKQNTTKSKLNTLSTMQLAFKSQSKGNTKLNLIYNNIIHNKLGVIGYYTKPQKFNSSKNLYEGIGVWKGNIDGVEVRIVLFTTEQGTNHIHSIHINKNDLRPMEFIKSLRQFLESENVNFITKFTIYNQRMIDEQVTRANLPIGKELLYHINETGFCNKNEGTAVYFNPNIGTIYKDFSKGKFSLLVQNNNLYLTLELKVDEKLGVFARSKKYKTINVRVLRYLIRDYDYLHSFNYEHYIHAGKAHGSILNSFLTNRPLDASLIYSVIEDLINGTFELEGFESTSVAIWLREIFKGVLFRYDYDVRNTLIINEVRNIEEEVDSLTDEQMADFFDNLDLIDESTLNELTAGLELSPFEEELEDDSMTDLITDTLLLFGEEMESSVMSYYSVLRSNKILDDFFQHLVTVLTHEEVSTLINFKQTTRSISETDEYRCLLWLLNLSKDEISIVNKTTNKLNKVSYN